MIVTRLQLQCDGQRATIAYIEHVAQTGPCPNHWPEDGAVNGDGVTHHDMRRHARKAGWIRKKIKSAATGFFFDADLCPRCARIESGRANG